MALERDKFKIGGVTFPLTAATTNKPLQDGEPAIYQGLLFFQSVLDTHLGDRWDAEITAIADTSMNVAIVEGTIGYDPEPYLTQSQIKFPLLAMYRVRDTNGDHSKTFDEINATHQVVWIMPPLTAAQAERLIPFLSLVHKVLNNRISNGADAAYSSGAQVWQTAGVGPVACLGAQYGYYQAAGDLRFPAVTIDLAITETASTPADAFDEIVDARTNIDLTDADGAEIDFVQIRTEDLDQ